MSRVSSLVPYSEFLVRLCKRNTIDPILALLFCNHMTLDKAFKLPGPQFPHLENAILRIVMKIQ